MDRVHFITGPTASGKTRLAVELARRIDAEIVSADSRQVFRGMDIGTGKDLDEYGTIPYHLIDIVDPGTRFSLHEWLTAARTALADIAARGKQAIVCGGTGLYIEALAADFRLAQGAGPDYEMRDRLEALPLPELLQMVEKHGVAVPEGDRQNPRRIARAIERQLSLTADSAQPSRSANPATVLLVDIPRETRRERIATRLYARLREGMVAEIEGLLAKGVPAQTLIGYGLEYRFVTLYLLGQMSYDDMVRDLLTAIRQFSKRQMTYFRGMERRGIPIKPFDLENFA